MIISLLQLRDYRNYTDVAFRPQPGINALVGNNAQGKTNLLEAIRVCSVGRSHRTAHDRELPRDDAEAALIRVEWSRRDGTHELSAVIPRIGARQIRIDGKPLRRSGELMGMLPSVIFAPEDLFLVKSGPAERRRFIDMELAQSRPGYYYTLQRYQRALKQRNNLLRELERQPALRDTLPGWNEVLAAEGAQIVRQRMEFVKRLDRTAAERHARISGGHESLRTEYSTQAEVANIAAGGNAGADDIAALLLARLNASLEHDLRRGGTSVGPHRDDLILTLDGRDARMYGSQGQQRTIALSLKLSELEIMHAETGEWPLLMLDDVMSELDPERRRMLIVGIAGAQTLITCTDIADLAGADVGTIARVTDGALTCIS